MIEVTKFRLVDHVSDEDFLAGNAEFQQGFVYQQAGLLRRTVASGQDGEWLSITWWRSMKDARQSASNASSSQIALAFNSLLEPASIGTQYFKELPG